MATNKQKNKALKRNRHRVSEGEVAPGIWEGLTQGVPQDEALAMFPVKENKGGVNLVSHMRDVPNLDGTRIPQPRFVAADQPGAHMIEENTGRVMQDAVITFTPETLRAIKEGHICLRCMEPQPESFPLLCDVCGYAMKDRQIMDLAMEFEGEKHLGPAKPIQEFLNAQDERMEKRRFIEKILGGGQGKIPQEWLNDRELFPDGPPPVLASRR